MDSVDLYTMFVSNLHFSLGYMPMQCTNLWAVATKVTRLQTDKNLPDLQGGMKTAEESSKTSHPRLK